MIARLAIAASVALWAGSGYAASPIVWNGGFLVTGVSGTECDLPAASISVDEMYTAVFHPKIAGDTSVTADVLQVIQGGVKAYRYSPHGSVHFGATGQYDATNWTARTTTLPFAGAYTWSQSPPTIKAATPFVQITGTLNGVAALDCNVTFSLALSRKQ